MSQSVPPGLKLDEIIFACASFLHGSVEIDTIPEINDKIPIMGHPDEERETECKFHLSADVVIVEGFVEPISVPEKDTAHLFICYLYKLNYSRIYL